jgi:glycosyltransferase involved in cell wall biosynthesis
MHIGMMADVYKPHISGITNYISLNKEYLEAAGHQVFVFTFGDEDHEDTEDNVIRSPGLPILDTGYYLSLNYSSQARSLIRTMDVVHIHHPFVSGSLVIGYCRPRGIPIIFTNHTRYDLYAHAYLPGMPDVVGATALQAYLPVFCRSCDLVIAPSAGMRDVMFRYGVESPVEVVPNGVDLKPFNQPYQPLDRTEFGFSPEDVVLTYVGRMGPEKNLPFLLRSFAGTAEAYENVKLMLIGGGKEVDNLKDRSRHMGIQELVKFIGMVPYDQVPRYLFMADAFVTASVTEVHPLSIIEAMAAGLPVLGIQSPGIGDTIQNGETGFLVREEDLAGFTAKLVRLVVNHDERKAMGQQARQAAEQYSIERTTQLMLTHYQQTVENASHKKQSLRTQLVRWTDRFRRG